MGAYSGPSDEVDVSLLCLPVRYLYPAAVIQNKMILETPVK